MTTLKEHVFTPAQECNSARPPLPSVLDLDKATAPLAKALRQAVFDVRDATAATQLAQATLDVANAQYAKVIVEFKEGVCVAVGTEWIDL